MWSAIQNIDYENFDGENQNFHNSNYIKEVINVPLNYKTMIERDLLENYKNIKRSHLIKLYGYWK